MNKRKTDFEEVYSLIKFGNKYHQEEVYFYYEAEYGLEELPYLDIIKKEGKMLTMNKTIYKDWDINEIPIHKIWVIIADEMIIFDRRQSYQGKKELRLPDHLDFA